MATHMMAPMLFFWYSPHWAGWKWSLMANPIAMMASTEDPARKMRNAWRVRPYVAITQPHRTLAPR